MTIADCTEKLRTISAAELEAFARDGFYVARRLFPATEVGAIRETFMAQAKDGPVAGLSESQHSGRALYAATDPLARYPRMMNPHRHADKAVGPLALRYLLDPRVEAILADLLSEEPIAAQSMFYFKPPGARGQDLHQDNFYLKVKPGTCMAAWTAVDSADTENGTLVVVPGSQKLAIQCPTAADSTRFFTTEHLDVPAGMHDTPVILDPGDVLFFNGSLIHGSYPNTSPNRFRRAFICHYLPRSATEISHWYKPLLDFRGREVTRAVSSDGGPCGSAGAVKGPH